VAIFVPKGKCILGAFALTNLCRYLVIIEVCEAVAIPCPLPIFDLSTKVFPPKDKKTN